MLLPWRDLAVGQNHISVGVPNALVTIDGGLLGQLALKSPLPIAATTANISDKNQSPGPAITTAEVEQFATEAGLEIAYCVDGGVSPLAQHLTIVDCTAHDSKITRHGVIHERAVKAALAGALSTDVSGS
jgi:L-threonylcarbamoyladenylate synthase